MESKDSRAELTPLNLVEGDIVERVRRLELFSRFRVEGLISGNNKSPFRGFTADFLQHRQYFRGDSLKYLDWRVFGKREKLYIKEYEELTNTTVSVIMDVSNSMSFRGSGRLSKFDFCVRCAALVFYMAFLHKDSFSLTCFNTGVVQRIPAGNSKKHLHRILRALVGQNAGGATDFFLGLKEAAAPIKRKGLTVVFSDFMEEAEDIVRVIARLRLEGSDVIAMHVFDPAESTLDFLSITRFFDLESPEMLTIDPLLVRREYEHEFEAHKLAMRKACLHHGFDHTALSVENEYEVPLMEYVRHRMELCS
ncbi:MAG: DUF58 domain-containing protein [Kiritimatiellae bacterium]|nr:DUF58 domain-containing protein [Kiritimatiellia bacterium]